MAQVHTDPMSFLLIPAAKPLAKTASFPFLSLPSELRNKIYCELLHSTEPVCPDPLGIQAFDHGPRTLFDTGCALIRTCKLVEAEATSVLYGSNIFKFSGGTSPYQPHSKAFGAKSVCGIMGIYTLLRSIGPGNRANIRHLLIEPCHADLFLAESELYDQEIASCGRQYLKAVELLSRQHGLEIFEITINPCTLGDMMALFWEKNAKPIQMMSKIKGLTEFRCWEPMDEDYVQRTESQPDESDESHLADMAMEIIRWLRKEMMVPKIEATKQPPRDSTATVHRPSRTPKLRERVAILEQERKQLSDVLRDAMTRLERVEKDIEQVRGAVGAIADMI